MININFNITNSFNNKDNHRENKSNISDNFPTLNQNFNKVNVETNSLSAVSLTNNASHGFINNRLKDTKSSIWRDIFVGVAGTIIGAIITYLILGIK